MDSTEQARRELIPTMPAAAQAELDAGRPVYTTEQMRAEFTVSGFAAPFVFVARKSDGAPGSLMFTSDPRYYFGFVPD